MTLLIGTNGNDDFNLTFDAGLDYGLLSDTVVGLDGNDAIWVGAGNDFLDGGNGDDLLGDGDGDDTVQGGDGNDHVYVDAGDDVYFGGSGNDTLIFTSIHAGMDPKFYTGGVKVDLTSQTFQNLGQLGVDRFFDFESATGSYGNDTMLGTGGTNWLDGNAGSDILNGRGGNDYIEGSDGADILIGGLGADSLFTYFDNGAQDSFRDVVRYESLKDSGTTASTRDTVYGFKHGQDKIDLKTLDANLKLKGNQAFKVVTKFTKALGEVKLVKQGADTLVQIDGDKDSAVDMTLLVIGAHLTKGDFIL